MPTWRSLPDAPSVQRAPQVGKFQTFVNEARSPLTLGAVGVNAAIMRETDSEHVTPGARPGLTTLYKDALIQKESSAFFGRYLYPSLLKQDPRYYPSTSASFLGRATYAVSRILITRRDSGERTLNTSYFLGVLTSVAIATAYRPYWARSASSTFKTFGSTIGSDAGINLFHEFRPGIRQMVKGHTPKFVSKIKEASPKTRSRGTCYRSLQSNQGLTDSSCASPRALSVPCLQYAFFRRRLQKRPDGIIGSCSRIMKAPIEPTQ